MQTEELEKCGFIENREGDTQSFVVWEQKANSPRQITEIKISGPGTKEELQKVLKTVEAF